MRNLMEAFPRIGLDGMVEMKREGESYGRTRFERDYRFGWRKKLTPINYSKETTRLLSSNVDSNEAGCLPSVWFRCFSDERGRERSRCLAFIEGRRKLNRLLRTANFPNPLLESLFTRNTFHFFPFSLSASAIIKSLFVLLAVPC